MGEMIGNIAHQWRQPLNALVLVIQSFQMKSMVGKLDDEFINKQVDEGIKLANSMSRTIDDFRNFFKPNKVEENFSIKVVIEEAVELLEHYYEKLEIKMRLICEDEFELKGYPNEFSQVLMNLFSNSKDILKEKLDGKKYIEIIVSKDKDNSDIGVISVIDNGGGISKEVQDRMFDPYFTTKHQSSGTGIGLYMSKEIIEKQMNGSITANNCSHRFSFDNEVYDKCACIQIQMPINKEK
jgi:signal transduction histidine kinase